MRSEIRVLHVDDEPGFADMAGTFLERHDDRLTVETATDASDGLDRLERGTFDCVISDYDMPDRNGLEFLEAVRASFPDIPFVLFTGKGSEEIASAAISAGVTDYLQKGTGTDQYAVLANRVANAAEKARTERRYRSLFENNPVVIWEEDLSAVKTYLDEVTADCDDVEAFIGENPDVLDGIYERIEIIDVNERALEYYGAASKEQLLENLQALMTEQSFEANKAFYAAIARGETRFRTETVIRTLDGRRRDELLELRVPEPSAADYSRVFITATDITERRERERELERQNARLDEVVSMVSHDLRTPLAVVDEELERAAAECNSDHVASARTALDEGLALVEELLSLAREDRGDSNP